MEELKRFIKGNRHIFDDQEPGAGHLNRFEERLDLLCNEKRSKKKTYISILTVAASLAILITIGFGYFRFYDFGENISLQPDSANEFTVTNTFYQEQMNLEISEIECKLAEVDESIRAQVAFDLESVIVENIYFVKNIQGNENTKLALLYLVKHYRSNLEALKLINSKLGEYINC